MNEDDVLLDQAMNEIYSTVDTADEKEEAIIDLLENVNINIRTVEEANDFYLKVATDK